MITTTWRILWMPWGRGFALPELPPASRAIAPPAAATAAAESFSRIELGVRKGRATACAQQLLPRTELDPGTARRLALFSLQLVDRFPARVGDEVDTTFHQQLVERGGVRIAREEACARVLQEQLDRLR